MKNTMNFHRKLVCSLLLFVGIVSMTELGIRLALTLSGISYQAMCEFNLKWYRASTGGYYQNYNDDYPYLPYRVRAQAPPSTYSNEKGYRGAPFEWQKQASVYRIACLGGSTTWEGTYPSALQTYLNDAASRSSKGPSRFQVLNFGAESWTSVESLINYSVRGVYASPDAIVIYHAINDMIAACHPPDMVPEPDYSHWRTCLRHPPTSIMNLVPLSLDHFCIVGSVRYVLYKRQAVAEWSTAMRRYAFDPKQAFQGTETFRRNINSIVAVARSNGTKVFLVTQIHSPDWSRKICSSDIGIERIKKFNEVTREIARFYSDSPDVVLIDAVARADAEGLTSEMTDWCHFTTSGYQRLGQLIGQAIFEQLRASGDPERKQKQAD